MNSINTAVGNQVQSAWVMYSPARYGPNNYSSSQLSYFQISANLLALFWVESVCSKSSALYKYMQLWVFVKVGWEQLEDVMLRSWSRTMRWTNVLYSAD